MYGKLIKWTKPLYLLVVRYLRLIWTTKENKILLVAEFGAYGGTRTYFFSLLQYLHNKQYKVKVLLKSVQADSQILNVLDQYQFEVVIDDYDFGHIAYNPKTFSKFNINPAKRTIHAINHYSKILLTQKCNRIICTVGSPEKYLFLFLLPLPVTYIIHTVVESKLEPIRMNWIKCSLSNKKQIYTVSEYSANALKSKWLGNHKKQMRYISYIYNYYPTPINTLHNKDSQHFRILTIGTVVAYKNPKFWADVAINLTSKYSQMEFYWLGDGSMLDEMKTYTAGNNNIHWEGHSLDVESWYNKADVYFQPSIKESFGISVAGAMAHGLPCVVSPHEGLPELITHECSGFIADISYIENASQIIENLYLNPYKRNEIGTKAKEKYLLEFTYQAWYNKMDKASI